MLTRFYNNADQIDDNKLIKPLLQFVRDFFQVSNPMCSSNLVI